jgi:hypothetical protein
LFLLGDTFDLNDATYDELNELIQGYVTIKAQIDALNNDAGDAGD